MSIEASIAVDEQNIWIKRHLRAARENPVTGEPLSLHLAAQEIGAPALQGSSLARWENGDHSPGAKYRAAVVAWIALRLGIQPPAKE